MTDLITCTGRPVDDRLQPHGQPCGRAIRVRGIDGDGLDQVAIAAGWSLAPDGSATCPSCRRPPPEVAALAREARCRG
jgi:hypothetical protein